MSEVRETPSIGPAELSAQLQAGEDVQLIDVREDYEWEAGRIEGARHIPLAELPASSDAIDRGRPIVFTCRSGGRSTMATEVFREAGFDATNLEGGLSGWVEAGLPIEPSDGEVAEPRPDAS